MGAGGLLGQARVHSASTRREGSFLSTLEAAARGAWLGRRPAIVHAHAATEAGFARKSLLWLARCAGCQTIFHLHGGVFRRFATVRSGLLKKGLAQLVELSGWLEPGARERQLNRAALAGLRARLGERARDTVAQHDSTEAVCGRLAAIHNHLAGAR
jgi:hypothetical protein